MDSSDIEVCKLQVRKVVQDVLKFVWFKHGLISSELKPELSSVPEIPAEFFNNLCVLVWIESPSNEFVWGEFLQNHFPRMTKTPYLFATYFAYAGDILIEKNQNTYACFVNILSLITHFTLYSWQELEDKKFLNCCVDLFCAFFDDEFCEKFEEQGRWKNFNTFLRNQESSKRYNELILSKKPANEIFKELQLRHLQSDEPYTINGVVLGDIKQNTVENHKKAICFADFVGDKIKKVCAKPFEEVVNGFSEIDNQLERLYHETVSVTSGVMEATEDQFNSLEVQENASDKANGTKDKDQFKETKEHKVLKDFPNKGNQKENLIQETVKETSGDTDHLSSLEESKATGPLEIRDSSPVQEETDYMTKENVLKAKAMLKEMQIYISKISELIKFLCQDLIDPVEIADTTV